MRILSGLISSVLALGTMAALAPPAQAAVDPWPGGSSVAVADTAGAFGTNLSGLVYDGASVWAVRNGPSTLYRLTAAGGVFSAAETYDLRFPGGAGVPDAEGVTVTDAGAASGVYVASERNDTAGSSGTSRPSVLRYAPTGAGGALAATTEWDLTQDLPGLGANKGLEAITWVPDSYLVAGGFEADDGTAYDPADHPGHGTGLFLVGVEDTGEVIAYALGDTATRIATLASGFPAVMELTWDPRPSRSGSSATTPATVRPRPSGCRRVRSRRPRRTRGRPAWRTSTTRGSRSRRRTSARVAAGPCCGPTTARPAATRSGRAP